MRGFLKVVAVAAIAATCATPAAAAGFSGGGGGPPGFSGGGPNSGDSAPVRPSIGDGAGSRGPSGPGHAPGGAPPRHTGGPDAGFGPPRHNTQPGFVGRGHDGANWRPRPRHYWLGGGPIFVPDPSGDYVYSDDDYDDGGDPTGCWVYRRAYDSAGAFLGFVHVDTCQAE